MSLLHVRVISPAHFGQEVEAILSRQPGATNIVALPGVARDPSGDLFQADLARECVQQVVSELRELGIDRDGSISRRAVDTAIGEGMQRAERAAPGDGTDAVLWDEVVASTGEDSTLTWTFMAFMVLACILAAIGVATNSPITIVGGRHRGNAISHLRQVSGPGGRPHLGDDNPGGGQRSAGPGVRALPRRGRIRAPAAHQPHRHRSRGLSDPARRRPVPYP
jgi:hypothetical protein